MLMNTNLVFERVFLCTEIVESVDENFGNEAAFESAG